MKRLSALDTLIQIPAASGFERPIADWLVSYLDQYDLQIHRDAIENVWTSIGTGDTKIALFAHLDELGFVTTRLHPNGLVSCACLGNWDKFAYSGRPVILQGTNGPLNGVSLPMSANPDTAMLVDFGVSSDKEFRANGGEVLQPVWLRRDSVAYNGKRLVSRALDNRLGACALLEMIELFACGNLELEDTEVIFIWTAQEEVGFRGTKVLANTMDLSTLSVAVSIDAYPAVHTSGMKPHEGEPVLGHGPVLRGADYEGVSTNAVVQRVIDIASEHCIPLQCTFARGNNQASVFRGVPWGAMDFPVASLHSAVETIDVRDYQNMKKLLKQIIEQWCSLEKGRKGWYT